MTQEVIFGDSDDKCWTQALYEYIREDGLTNTRGHSYSGPSHQDTYCLAGTYATGEKEGKKEHVDSKFLTWC